MLFYKFQTFTFHSIYWADKTEQISKCWAQSVSWVLFFFFSLRVWLLIPFQVENGLNVSRRTHSCRLAKVRPRKAEEDVRRGSSTAYCVKYDINTIFSDSYFPHFQLLFWLFYSSDNTGGHKSIPDASYESNRLDLKKVFDNQHTWIHTHTVLLFRYLTWNICIATSCRIWHHLSPQ